MFYSIHTIMFLPTKDRGLGQLKALGTVLCSILQPLQWDSQLGDGDTKVSKVAYLDGLRGFASILVYISHHVAYAHPQGMGAIRHAFGWQDKFYFISTPGIRAFFHGGSFAVALFFVISGYVLSRSLLSLLHAHETARLASRLGVAIPQRFVRLWTPVCCTTFIFMTCWYVTRPTPKLETNVEYCG